MTAKGYKLPADIMNVRLVHLLDASKRKELMIIYGEDLAPTGLTTTQLIANGQIHPQWASIEKDLISRAISKINFNPKN